MHIHFRCLSGPRQNAHDPATAELHTTHLAPSTLAAGPFAEGIEEAADTQRKEAREGGEGGPDVETAKKLVRKSSLKSSLTSFRKQRGAFRR